MLRFVPFFVLLPLSAAVPALMPEPQKVEPGSGRLAIDGRFNVSATGCSSSRMNPALDRFRIFLAHQTGIPMAAPDSSQPTLRVQCSAHGAEYPKLGEDESYTLDVSSDGAVLKAANDYGALHGLETFAQLIVPGSQGFEISAVHIEDRPRFQWRGLMMDVSRHWMPVDVVERNLDAMAAVKLNVFHWHLSDDQGFRVESKRYKRLQEYGSNGHYYTQAQIREIVAYARDRGIRVIPEFDMPGHFTSWLAAYPKLASAPGPYEIGDHFGGYQGTLDPSREENYKFLDGFIGEMAKLFPDPYFHIGGDEVNARQWNESERIQAFARKHKLVGAHAIQLYFNQRIQKILKKHKKIMVGWDEILQPDLAPGTVIQSWRGQASLADSVLHGYRGILSWGYYLDHLSPARYHYSIDPLDKGAEKLTPEQASQILGGEAAMWAELVDAETVDSRIWPRTAAIAERFWSAKDVTDPDSMYDRLEVVSRWLEWTGVRHRANFGPMLDRMSGGRPDEPVRVLAEASEALGLGPRKARGLTTQSPLNSLVDADRPESESVRALERIANRVTAGTPDPQDLARLREQFTRWAANDARFQPLADGDALLAEVAPLSRDLSELGTTGLKAIEYLEGTNPAPADWLTQQQNEITRIQKPQADVVLAAYRPVKALLDALSKRAGAVTISK